MTVYRRRLSVEIDLAQDEFTFPVVVEVAGEVGGAELEDGFGGRVRPAHA